MTNILRIRELQSEIAYLEQQLNIPTLSHSDQQLLSEAWFEYQEEIDRLEEEEPSPVSPNPWSVHELEDPVEDVGPPGGSPPERPDTPVPAEPHLFIDYSSTSGLFISEDEIERMNNALDDRMDNWMMGGIYGEGQFDLAGEV
jgi:hypothetical protein